MKLPGGFFFATIQNRKGVHYGSVEQQTLLLTTILQPPPKGGKGTNMEMVNLTPHPINILNADGSSVSVPPSGAVLRVAVTRNPLGQMAGVDVFETNFGDLEVVEGGLSSPAFGPGATFNFRPETVYIVSGICAGPLALHKGELKFASPGELVRDAGGQPKGCKGLTLI